MRSDKNKIIYILIIMIIMMVMNNQDIEAQDKPKPPPPISEREKRMVEEIERAGVLLPLERLEYYRAKQTYKGIYPSHNGIDVSKVVVRGKKFCDVEVHEEAVMLRNYMRRNGVRYHRLFEISPYIKSKLWNPNEIRQLIYITDNEKDLVAFVFDKGIIVFMNDNIDKNYSNYYIAMPEDGSKIFLNSVLISSSAKRIVATTPTTYIVAGKKGKLVEAYDELVGADAPDLKNPTIREGKPGVIYIKDEVMGKNRVEIHTTGGELLVGVQPGD